MKRSGAENISIEEMIKGKKLPILVLDQRWHKLFPGGKKPGEIRSLEQKLNALLKEQGKLVNEVKSLKVGKKKLMDAIVAGMSADGNNRKKDKQQKLLLETNERLEKQSERLMELPYEIKDANEKLLVVGVRYCYNEWANRTEELKELTDIITTMREDLKEKVAHKVDLEESVDATYSLMHALLGREVMNLFDKDRI